MRVEERSLIFYLEKVVHAPQEVMEDFEGPLDLILYLLSKHKIEIQDLQISLLCQQFLAWIEAREALDMEVASEFVAMASHLVYLKSKNLLMVGERQDEELDELKRQLEERLLEDERRKLERAREFLSSRAEIYRMILAKRPEPLRRDPEYAYVHESSDLLAALRDISTREQRRAPPPTDAFSGIVGREPYPVAEKIQAFLRKLASSGRILFSGLFHGVRGRSERVAAFLAILEMCRNREIVLADEGGEVWVSAAPKEGEP